MRLEDALFNWLQITVVAEARPDDRAAVDTCAFFSQLLHEDHAITELRVERTDETMIHIRYVQGGRSKLHMFDREAGEQLLADINSNPKYNE
ncbi:hypothetical protein FHS18_001084 [Paenibacillus phyllosphaerae]|uniref:Uncharacterized protein n=1 Tax=Paenibacillus phyllosphaerae TaxID=274593 RepID=A0A7W5FLI7_9BACL|nr:hypothetical protein [Paenibacillus phyllosphaerae]MBB3109032.1 hypothetical protein [Paenibacillus phyllosphaerae]